MPTVQQTAQAIDRIENRWRYSSANGDATVEQAQADVEFLVEHIGKLEALLRKCRHDLTTYDGLWACDKHGDYEVDEHFRLDTEPLLDEIDKVVS